jgi:hypothetical protein
VSEEVLRRKLHNGKIGSKCDTHGGNKKCIQNFCWKPKKKRFVGRPKHNWENIKIDLKGTGCDAMNYIHLTQDTVKWQSLVNIIKNLQDPLRWGVPSPA